MATKGERIPLGVLSKPTMSSPENGDGWINELGVDFYGVESTSHIVHWEKHIWIDMSIASRTLTASQGWLQLFLAGDMQFYGTVSM